MLAHHVETLPQLLLKRVQTTPNRESYRERRADGSWVGTTWTEFRTKNARLVAGLHGLGVERGDTMCIIGGCRPEWVHIDMAALSMGMRTVGIYETLMTEQVKFILEDSGAKVLVVHTDEQLERLKPLLDQIESLEHLIAWGCTKDCAPATPMAAIEARGAEAVDTDPQLVEGLIAAVERDDVAIVVYTSGTTGQPKGVPLSHGLIIDWMRSTQHLLIDDLGDDDITISFLPLAHVAEHVPGFFGRMNVGLNTAYATSYDTLLDELMEVRPTYFGAVPRIFEKMYGRIRERVAQANPRRQAIFNAARELARRKARADTGVGPALSVWDRMWLPVADRLVYRKIREVFGGRVKVFITGSAPIDIEILEFFYGIGMTIHEVYGLSEACAISFANTSEGVRLGTVGRIIPGLDCKMADDGEILLKGPMVFGGYLNLEDRTNESFDEDGYFHTGDIGQLDADGYLKITDRKKSLIKTAGGKYVVPARLQMFVKEEPSVGQVYVHGDNRPYAIALITLDEREGPRLAEELGCSIDELPSHPDIIRRMDEAVARANTKLASFEQIKHHAVLPKDFSIEEGTLTATMKLKRKVVAEMYADVIDQLYSEATARHKKAS